MNNSFASGLSEANFTFRLFKVSFSLDTMGESEVMFLEEVRSTGGAAYYRAFIDARQPNQTSVKTGSSNPL